MATSYFQTQPKLTSKQSRWQQFLAEFDFDIEYKPGRTNSVPDALSRKVQLATVSSFFGPARNPIERVKAEMEKDPWATSMGKLIMDGKARRF